VAADQPIAVASGAVDRSAALWSNSVAQLVGVVIARVSRAGGILYAARALGPDGFGLVATALAAYEMLRVTGEAGLDTRLIRHAAQHPATAASATRQTLWLKLRLYAVLALAALALAAWRSGSAGALLLGALAIGTPGLALAGSAQAIATARLDARGLIPYQAAAGVLFFGLVAGAAYLIRTPTATALALGLGDLTAGAVLLGYVALRLRLTEPGPRATSDWAALREAWPVGAIGILGTAYARVGIAGLALYWGSAAVAQYGVSYRVVEVFLLASSAVAGSAYAVTARVEAEEGGAQARVLLDAVVRRVAVPVLLIGVGVAVAATWLPTLFGIAYMPAVATTRVLAWSLPVMFVNGLLTAHLYGRGRFHTVLRIALVNLGVTGLVLALLLPTGGPAAAALAVVCTECANTWLQSRAAGLGRGAWSWRLAALCLAAGLITFALGRHAL
jgi:O-antigen/teichoic acid export membrane protein